MSEQKNADQNPSSTGSDSGASYDVSIEIQKLQDQAEKYKNEFLYLRAEFDNYKKHAIKERSDLIKYGGERLVRDLLAVLDNFERALSAPTTPENSNIFRQGVEMTANELRSLLQKNGISEVKSEGVPFDPNMHEALSSEITEQMPAGNILRVFQKAYKFHDKLLRPAQVVVARKAD